MSVFHKIEHETSILVILYNTEILSSITLVSLLNSNVNLKGYNLVIWNNGPNKLSDVDIVPFQEVGFYVQIVQTIENTSLANIYNTFIKMHRAVRYVILDHDSNLSDQYLMSLSTVGADKIGVPIIYCDGDQVGPLLNCRLCLSKDIIRDEDAFVAIGSGLVIGFDITKTLKETQGQVFDERFFLYGVDTTFFLRLKISNLNHSIEILSGFEHSLSRFENENLLTKKFRKLERTYDLALTLRFYYSPLKIIYFVALNTLKYFFHRLLKRDTLIYYIPFVKALFTGRHYRDIK
ncbi:hypothetical protein [Paraglaciecola sp. 20A4]|uniref:hypothetical protein n=1 Tax=Paraglaciecola sp. 20A4 TaxID=2687288 RepID=UPI00140B19B9|nr:hypothetical protein [Paraglaciecola sp. 20A4]